MTKAIRFGVEMMGPFDGLTWAESARELESLGYSTLFVPDHLDEGYGPITAMATAADSIELTAQQISRLDNLTPAAGSHHEEADMRLLGR